MMGRPILCERLGVYKSFLKGLPMAEVLHQRADEQKEQVRSTKRAGKPIPQSSRRNGGGKALTVHYFL